MDPSQDWHAIPDSENAQCNLKGLNCTQTWLYKCVALGLRLYPDCIVSPRPGGSLSKNPSHDLVKRQTYHWLSVAASEQSLQVVHFDVVLSVCTRDTCSANVLPD